MRFLLLVALWAAPAAAERLHHPFKASSVIDLTHEMREDMPFWPGGVPFSMKRLADYEQGYRTHEFRMGENTGTHLDAPAHFVKGKATIDRIRLRDLIAAIVVIDVRRVVRRDPDYQVTVADIEGFEKKHGRISDRTFVVLNTGWHRRFRKGKRYVNIDAEGVMHFPGLSRKAAKFLLGRGAVGIGIDTLSLDHGPSQDFPAHTLVMGAGRHIVENLANVNKLPPTGATVVIGVLLVKKGTQAQARVLAFLP